MSIMLGFYLKKYRSMLLCGIFFFYLGCGLTLSLLKMDCASDAVKKNTANAASALLDSHNHVEYAVVILSAINHKDVRDVIRKTWIKLASNIVTENGERVFRWHNSTEGSKLPEFVRIYFVLGVQNVKKENSIELIYELEENNDLLFLSDVPEGYPNLSNKMLRTLEWLNGRLKNLKYVIKCDDDSFVRVDLIIKDLETYGTKKALELTKHNSFKLDDDPSVQGLYWGYFNGQAHVFQSGKWEEKDWFQCDNYLPYALGGGYVISQNIVQYVGSNANWLRPYKSEDVSMGLWTSALRGIDRVHDTRFDTEWKSRGCQHDMLVRHKQNTTEILNMYKKLISTQGKKLCPIVSQVRKSYRYDWNVPPSKCCK